MEADNNNAIGNENISILRFEVKPLNGDVISISSGIQFELGFDNYKPNINLDATFELKSADDYIVFHHGAMITTNYDAKIGSYTVKGIIKPHLLNSGVFLFNVIFGENQRALLFSKNEIVQFEIMNENLGSNSANLPGILRPEIDYDISFIKTF